MKLFWENVYVIIFLSSAENWIIVKYKFAMFLPIFMSEKSNPVMDPDHYSVEADPDPAKLCGSDLIWISNNV